MMKLFKKAKPERAGRRTKCACAKRVEKGLCKFGGRLAVFAFLTFAVTFCIYMFNLENKLIYYVIRPIMNKHYDSQTRDRRV